MKLLASVSASAALALAMSTAASAAGEAAYSEEPRGEIVMPRGAAPPCGTVLLSGSGWLGGGGVDVHSNGATQGGRSCAGFSVADRTVQNGGGWQCVEVAARLYHVKGWGIVYAGRNGGARYIPEGSPDLQFHPNGSGYTPVQGDLVVEAFGTYGHVTVVDRVEDGAIHAVEQNAATSGRKSYPWSGGVAQGAYNGGAVRGFMHSPLNTATPGSGSRPTTGLNAVRGKVARRFLVLKWQVPPVIAPRGFRVQLKRRDVRAGAWSPGVTLPSAARKFRIRITRGKIYRLRVAAVTSTGAGPWATTKILRP